MRLEDYVRANFKDENILQLLSSIAHPFEAEDSQRLLSAPEICDRMFYIEEGIVREYTWFDSETETTTWIMSEGTLIYSIESYILQVPTRHYLQALTPVKGYYFYKTEVESLLQSNPMMAFVAYKLSESYILRMEARNHLHRLKKLRDRYLLFEKQQPGVAVRIKGKILANYLNVRPQQLSKLRRELAREA